MSFQDDHTDQTLVQICQVNLSRVADRSNLLSKAKTLVSGRLRYAKLAIGAYSSVSLQQRILTVGGSITVRLVSSFTRLH